MVPFTFLDSDDQPPFPVRRNGTWMAYSSQDSIQPTDHAEPEIEAWWCGALDFNLLQPMFALPLSFSSFISPCFIYLFFLTSHYHLFFLKCEPCWKDERLTMSSVMNGLRVPWAWYTLPFSLPLLTLHGGYGEQTSYNTHWLSAHHERRHLCSWVQFAQMRIVEGQFIRVWPGEAQRGQHAVDLQYFAGCPNL